MADISTYIQNIRTAVYGEEVRGSIINALTAMNTESSKVGTFDTRLKTAETNAKAASDGVASAKKDASSAVSVSVGSKVAAEQALDTLQNVSVSAHTLETGQPATVTKHLVDNNLSLDFGLPRGPQGTSSLVEIPGKKGQVLGYPEDNGINAEWLEVGGRNFIPNSDFNIWPVTDAAVLRFFDNASGKKEYIDSVPVVTVTWSALGSVAFKRSNIKSIPGFIDAPNTMYTCTLRCHVNSPITANVRISTRSNLGALIKNHEFKHVLQPGWSTITDRISLSTEDFDEVWIMIADPSPLKGSAISIEWVKLELGSAATNWSLAPEDIQRNYPANHRNVYRGSFLGTSVTDAQYSQISAGTFYDLYIGDYWTINGTDYLIADLDYWYNTGDTNFTKHHAVIVPRLKIGANKQMNSSNTTENAYYGSEMYSTNLNDAKTKITTDFRDAHILSHNILLENAVKNGYPSGYLLVSSKIDLMTETMVYGTRHHAPMGNGLVTPIHYTIDKTQLALFKLYPQAISTRQNYWLRDVVNATDFAYVNANGNTATASASATYSGVRPAFAIGV